MAVINRTECLINMKSIRHQLTQGIVLLVFVLMGMANFAQSIPHQGCDLARNEVLAAGYPSSAGFPNSAVLERPNRGPICGEDSCCSSGFEQDLLKVSKEQINTFVKDSITKLSSLIDVRAKKFDGLFREMMNTSKMEFHLMFQRTYGKIYLQNSDVFSDFFQELETYYKKGSVRLTDVLESFFGILYQRMFTVINSQYTFNEKYLECVSEHMIEMKPFGDVPHKLTLQLKRSFVATRTYYKALIEVAEAAKKMNNLKLEEDCEKEFIKMQYCGSCKGMRGSGACSNYCSTVLESCLRHHIAFSSEWDNFVDALDKIADRLVGPYNIEMVVEPLNIKISEAVMNFQESGTEVSKKIFTLCGKPTLSRRRRKAPTDGEQLEDNPEFEIKNEPIKMHGGHKKKKNKKHEEEETVSTLERLIREIKSKIRETRQFWAHLPYQYCNNAPIAPPSSNGNCWNGESVGNYTESTAPKSTLKLSPVVSEQIFALKMFSDKLRKAYQGDEVEIVDDSEDNFDGSGSGSGDFGIEEEDTSEEVHIVPETPVDIDTIDEVPDEHSTTKSPEIKRTSTSGGASSISLSRALLQYLLPIVLVWFGGAITDLL